MILQKNLLILNLAPQGKTAKKMAPIKGAIFLLIIKKS